MALQDRGFGIYDDDGPIQRKNDDSDLKEDDMNEGDDCRGANDAPTKQS